MKHCDNLLTVFHYLDGLLLYPRAAKSEAARATVTVPLACGSIELLQQGLCLPQVGRVKPFGKPVIDPGQ